MTHFRFVAFAAAFAAVASGTAVAQVREQHGVYEVFCRADLYCTAETKMGTTDGLSGTFKLERGSAPGGKVFLTASPSRALAEGIRIDMDVYGTGLDRVTGIYGPVNRIYPGNEMTFAHDATDNIVEWIRRGTVIDVTAAHEGATDTYRASLEGVTEALLAFDRIQGRIGRRDAIVAFGPAPESADGQSYPVPIQKRPQTTAPPQAERRAPPARTQETAAAPAPEPRSAPAQRQMVSSTLVYELGDVRALMPQEAFGFGCQFDETLPGYGALLWEFSDNTYLLVAPCEPADVNITTVVVAGQSGQQGRVVEFDLWDGVTKLPINASYDDNEKAISTTTYFGPDADCGEHFVHDYFGGETGSLAVRTRYEKSECDGQFGPPTDWPQTYSAAN